MKAPSVLGSFSFLDAYFEGRRTLMVVGIFETASEEDAIFEILRVSEVGK